MSKIICITNCCLFSMDYKVMLTIIIAVIIIVLAIALPKIIKLIYEYKTIRFKLKQKELEEKKDLLEAKKKYERMNFENDRLQKRESILKYLIDSTENSDKVEEYKNELQNLYK